MFSTLYHSIIFYIKLLTNLNVFFHSTKYSGIIVNSNRYHRVGDNWQMTFFFLFRHFNLSRHDRPLESTRNMEQKHHGSRKINAGTEDGQLFSHQPALHTVQKLLERPRTRGGFQLSSGQKRGYHLVSSCYHL